jgi:hypothetical protein
MASGGFPHGLLALAANLVLTAWSCREGVRETRRERERQDRQRAELQSLRGCLRCTESASSPTPQSRI